MINTDRIVQVSRTDLLTLYGNMLTIAGTTLTAAQAVNPGEFEITEAPASGSIIAAEPVASLDFGEDVSAATVYFIAAYDYAGFTINGSAVETAGATVSPDASTLYTATLSSGAVTIAKIGF